MKKSSPASPPMDKTSRKSLDSTTSYEEGDVINYDHCLSLGKVSARTAEYYFQELPYKRPTETDYEEKQFKGAALFKNAQKLQIEESNEPHEEHQRDPSILISGFGMRNIKSVQKLIKMSQEERKKWELKKLWRDESGRKAREFEIDEDKSVGPGTARTVTSDVSTTTGSPSKKSSTDFLSQTESTEKADVAAERKKHLEYLMGLEAEIEEEPEPFVELAEFEDLKEDTFKYSSSKAVRESQRYLRTHRIFECFQFIIAHLLSANPENPIEFILNLINRCLLYRSGLGEPPLLYNRKHITQLFNIMDRLQSGSIDKDQYFSGMKTIGVCSYNENPETNEDGEILKEIFIEEAYEAQVAIFNDMIKRRQEKAKKGIKKSSDKAFDTVSIPSFNPPYFIPSDLFKRSKPIVDNIDQFQLDAE